MSELSDEASESDQLSSSLSLWLGESLIRPEELDVPLDLHTACSIGQYDVVAECIQKWVMIAEPVAFPFEHILLIQYLLFCQTRGGSGRQKQGWMDPSYVCILYWT